MVQCVEVFLWDVLHKTEQDSRLRMSQLQCVSACFSVLQSFCGLTCTRQNKMHDCVCCSAQQCVVRCCSVLQCVAVYWWDVLHETEQVSRLRCNVLQCVAVGCSVLQCVAVCCRVVQCVVVCCSV